MTRSSPQMPQGVDETLAEGMKPSGLFVGGTLQETKAGCRSRA